MVRKSKGRQKIEMVKMKNESNLLVTFSKRRAGLFKKASEISTLCGAEVALIVNSPGQKVFSFGHPNVDTIVDRYLNNVPPPFHQPNDMDLNEVRRNSIIRDLNNNLTQVMNNLESEKKKNEELKKMRENSKRPVSWWEEPVERLDLAQANEFKANLENLKKMVTVEASKFFQANMPNHNFYYGSSSSAPFGVGGGNNINPDFDQFNQRRMVDMNAFYNQNTVLPNYSLSLGNNNHGNIAEGFAPAYNMSYQPEYNQNQNQNPSFKVENNSGNEHPRDGHPL